MSNFSCELEDLLDEKKLLDYFEKVIASEVVGVEKPNKEILEMACKELNVAIDECIYIGDHPFDVYCAKREGMDVIWIKGDYDKFPDYIEYKPDYIINQIVELHDL